MLDERKILYFNILVDLRQVSQSVFGTVLHPCWMEHLHFLRVTLHMLHEQVKHVEQQWVERNGWALGKEGGFPRGAPSRASRDWDRFRSFMVPMIVLSLGPTFDLVPVPVPWLGY